MKLLTHILKKSLYPLFFMLFLPVFMWDHGIPGLAFDATLSDRYRSLVATSFTNDAISNVVYQKKAEKNFITMCNICGIYLKRKRKFHPNLQVINVYKISQIKLTFLAYSFYYFQNSTFQNNTKQNKTRLWRGFNFVSIFQHNNRD